MWVRYLCAILLSSISFSQAGIRWNSPVSIENYQEFSQWSLNMRQTFAKSILARLGSDTKDADSYMECSELKELSGAVVCQSFFQATMNATFTRMGFFMGAAAGTEPGVILPLSEPVLSNYEKLIAGHNLPGKVILDFFNHFKMDSYSDGLSEFERSFEKDVVQSDQLQALGDRFYVLGISVQNSKPLFDVISHEVHHAEYALNPCYSRIVNDFWAGTVTPDDRDLIKSILGRAYNQADSIIIDEFQAYLLQTHSEQDLLGLLTGSYRVRLIEALSQAGCRPLKIEELGA